MSREYREFAQRDLRLVLLRCLAAQPGYRGNESILQSEARAFGLERSRDVIRNELRWLAEVGVVRIEEVGSVIVAKLLRRGKEHVDGLTEIEGVNKPSPEA